MGQTARRAQGQAHLSSSLRAVTRPSPAARLAERDADLSGPVGARDLSVHPVGCARLRLVCRRRRWKRRAVPVFIKNSRASRIIAVEPQTTETDIMSTNLRLNHEHGNPKLTVLNCFVGTSSAPDFTSLDSLKLDLNLPGLVKIDVDGLEVDVLKSGERTISNGRPRLLVETHSKALEDECVDWLTRRGYLVRIIANAWWRFAVPEQRPTAHNRWLWAEKPPQGS